MGGRRGERGGGDGAGGRMMMRRQRNTQNIPGLKLVWNTKMVGYN